MADRTNEIIRLQNQIILDMTRRNLLKVGDDLWGPISEDTVELTPPPGYPPVPDALGEGETEQEKQRMPRKSRKKRSKRRTWTPCWRS